MLLIHNQSRKNELERRKNRKVTKNMEREREKKKKKKGEENK